MRREDFLLAQHRSGGGSATCSESLLLSRLAFNALLPPSASLRRVAVIIVMFRSHKPLAATDLPCEGSR